MNQKIKDMVENPHLIHRRYSAFWDFLLQSYEGGIDYSNSGLSINSNPSDVSSLSAYYVDGKKQQAVMPLNGNLFPHPKERTQDYNQRVRMSYYYNFPAPIIDIYGDHLFKQKVIVDFGSIEEDVKEVENDIDRQGSSIDEFRKSVSDMAQIHGHCFIITDSPKTDSELIVNRRQQIDLRAFPYFSLYSPKNLINWSLDENGFPYWVLLREVYDANSNPVEFDKNAKQQCVYRLWTRDTWQIYDDKYELVDAGFHDLGKVPITCAFDKRSRKARNFLGISSIADISLIARDIYNLCSELRQILRDQTFAFLAIQGTSSEYSELELGTGKGLLYPEGREVPQYVSPSAENANTYFQKIDRQVAKIYQLAKLDSGGLSATVKDPGTVDNNSGVSKAWDFNQTNSSLSSKSSNLEDAEMDMWTNFALWQGKKFDGSVQYPTEFSISSLKDDLNEAEQMARLDLGTMFNLEIRKAIIKKKFPRKPEEEISKMENEVEQLLKKGANTPGSRLSERVSTLFNNTATSGQPKG